MAKVFNGGEFLKSNACTMKLSNGEVFIVEELPQGIIKEVSAMPDDADDTAITRVLAKFLGVDPIALEGIGLVECKGALSFLYENLLDSK